MRWHPAHRSTSCEEEEAARRIDPPPQPKLDTEKTAYQKVSLRFDNIAPNISKEMFFPLIGKCRPVSTIEIDRQNTDKTCCYAVVNGVEYQKAQQAVTDWNDKTWQGRRLKVKIIDA